MQLNGAEIVIECLKEQGVDTVFGYPGGAILNVYDELYKHRDEIRHILTSHEQGASHAADGYSRATGKVGVCLATSGPGATNLVTGIAPLFPDVTIDANLARYPVFTFGSLGCHFSLLFFSSSSETARFKDKFGISICIMSPSSTRAIGPPTAASGNRGAILEIPKEK